MRVASPSLRAEFYTPDTLPPLVWYPSGIGKVDDLLGGGLAAGRVVEFFGPNGIGKSTMALHFRPDIYLDVERSAEPGWFTKFSPDTEIVQPESAEHAWELILVAAKAQARIVVLDSLGSMVSQSEFEDRGGTAVLSRSTSHYLRRIIPCLGNTTLLVCNQVRSVLGTVPGFVTSPGGHFFHHLCTQRIEFKPRGEWVTVTRGGQKTRLAHAVRLYLQKNKLGNPYREAVVYMVYGHGVAETEDEAKRRAGDEQRGEHGDAD